MKEPQVYESAASPSGNEEFREFEADLSALFMRSLDELNVLDNFMLNAIAMDSDIREPFFKEVLSVLLQREI